MKNIYKIISSGIMLGFIFSSCASSKDLTQGTLVWKEDFNQKQNFDTKIWSKIPRGTADWNNTMSDQDTLYEMRKGKLVLKGMQNTIAPQDSSKFLTGGVYTKGKLSFGYGRWEVKAKLNAAKGAWPAFWLLPENEKWPYGGEIDIMERLNHDDFVYQTVHSHYTYTLGIKDPKPGFTGKINPKTYNIYSVEIHPERIDFFVNHQKTFSYPKIKTEHQGQFPFSDYRYYLLLDMQLGGSWVGEVDAKQLPVEMEIDWVKFYSFDRNKP
ncbi:glycoside hydrolase family 16 protein [Elizabethkingia sp. JS20170427COW]|uniref:glycoside hydrolase family 16 protein n=1 Tax=Elizabethkingia sp. JS20170427COW TaxID=2583851 RepID=UPI001110A6F6|nr:glycoside hydrolase family 16 protein [Elizabethkingia sp. JS20170427COW]QCX52563.1 glycoside hydrolase family 16 protein [Elizabethkingia sp. JS20170427COW]